MGSDFGKRVYFELVGLVFPFAFIFEKLARTLSPATLGHHRLCCCLCCCTAAVVLVWCCCGGFDGGGAAAVAFAAVAFV